MKKICFLNFLDTFQSLKKGYFRAEISKRAVSFLWECTYIQRLYLGMVSSLSTLLSEFQLHGSLTENIIFYWKPPIFKCTMYILCTGSTIYSSTPERHVGSPGNGIHMTLPMELFSIPFPTQCFTSVFLTVSMESQSKWWLFRLSFHNQCILSVLWWWKNHPHGQVDPKHSSEGHTVCPKVFKWRNKNFQWDLQRMKGHASGGQNMFCLKSYIKGKRIH